MLNEHSKQVPHGILKHHVEVGANTCFDQEIIEDIIIVAYTKAGNLVHATHNARVGKNCIVICSCLMCNCNLEGRVNITPRIVI